MHKSDPIEKEESDYKENTYKQNISYIIMDTEEQAFPSAQDVHK